MILQQLKIYLRQHLIRHIFGQDGEKDGSKIAEEVAKANGGTTLEMLMEKKDALINAGFPYDIHKSYLVNMNYIKIFRSDDVVMQDDESFPISIRKRKNVIEQYMSFASM